MKKNRFFKLIYKYRWLLIIIYISIASLATFTAVISAKSPTFKYEIRCLEPQQSYKNVIDNLTFKDEVTFCVDNLVVDNLNGFYKSNSDYIYLDNNNLEFEKTIYHEYSHFLMSKKIKETDVKQLIADMNLTDEKLTDITAFFLLLERGQTLVDIQKFSYIEPIDLLSLDNEDFWTYIAEVYEIEGLKEDPDTLFTNWIEINNQQN